MLMDLCHAKKNRLHVCSRSRAAGEIRSSLENIGFPRHRDSLQKSSQTSGLDQFGAGQFELVESDLTSGLPPGDSTCLSMLATAPSFATIE